MHLFDIQITGGQHFMESATLTAGDEVTVFDTEFCRNKKSLALWNWIWTWRIRSGRSCRCLPTAERTPTVWSGSAAVSVIAQPCFHSD